jgi:hypothetical protein
VVNIPDSEQPFRKSAASSRAEERMHKQHSIITDASTTYTNPILSACKNAFASPRYQLHLLTRQNTVVKGGWAFASYLVFSFKIILGAAESIILFGLFYFVFIVASLRACCVQGFGWSGLDLML